MNNPSVQNILDRMVPTSAATTNNNNFEPASTWQGPREGYYFGTASQGTGYYRDEFLAPQRNAKKKRSVQIDETQNEMRLFQKPKTPKSLLEQAEQDAQGTAVLELTPKGIQSASTALCKLWEKNALLRAQHADNPSLYMDSELALHDQLQALTAVAAAHVQLYRYILGNNTSSSTSLFETLVQLLGHENEDIAAMVVSIFWEWVDPTLLNDGNEDATRILQDIASQVLVQAWETIVTNLGRFASTRSSVSAPVEGGDTLLQGMENTLSLMENLLDLDLVIPGGILDDESKSTSLSVAAYMVQETRIVSWLVEQIDTDDDDTTTTTFRGRCLELLSLVAQREDVHGILDDWSALPKYTTAGDTTEAPPTKKQKTTTATLDAIESMLQIVGGFRKRQPENETETDLLENACLALSSCITFSTRNAEAFLKGQGIELVVRCLKEKVHAAASALKLLDFNGKETCHKQACERLVTAGGLKFLFPLFLGTRIPQPAPSYATTTKAKKEWLNGIETQTIRIFYALSRHLDDDSPEDVKARFLAKFAQDETKCDRLVELLLYYDEKSRKAEYNFYRSDVEDVVEDEETVELAALDAKLKGGGDLFHRLGALMAFCAVYSKRCHERILTQLKLMQSGISLVKMALEEFLSLLEEGSQQREQLEAYLSKI